VTAKAGRSGRRVVTELVDGEDVRVLDASERPGLAFEAGQPIGIPRHRIGQHLHGHVAVQALIAGAVHLAHAALADLRENAVRPKRRAGGRGHDRRSYTGQSDAVLLVFPAAAAAGFRMLGWPKGAEPSSTPVLESAAPCAH
jgi:hypothetical protein